MKKFNTSNVLAIAAIAGLAMHRGLHFDLDIDGGGNPVDESAPVAPVAPVESAPVSGTAAIAAIAPVAPPVPTEIITLKGHKVTLRKGVISKGKHKGNPDYALELSQDEAGVQTFAQIVGPANFLRTVFKDINSAVREASNEAFEVVDGKLFFNLPKFETNLVEHYNPDRSRKTGPSKAELQEMVNNLVGDVLMPLIKKQGTAEWSDDDAMQMATVTKEIGELQAKIAAKTKPVKAAK